MDKHFSLALSQKPGRLPNEIVKDKKYAIRRNILNNTTSFFDDVEYAYTRDEALRRGIAMAMFEGIKDDIKNKENHELKNLRLYMKVSFGSRTVI